MPWRIWTSSHTNRITLAEELTRFRRGDASVGGETIKMVEAGAGGPRGERGFAEMSEAFLEAVERDAGEGIARGDGATRAGIAALEMDFADLEADDAALVFAEELVFPEGGHAFNFERGAEAQADFVQREAGKPFANGLERSRGDDRGAVGDGVVGKTAGRIADEDLLLEEHAEPFGGVIVAIGERERVRGNATAVAGNGKRDISEIGSENGADQVNGGSALAIDPAAIHGIERPGAVERQAAGRTDARFADGDGVERFDGMEAQIRQARSYVLGGHEKSLAEVGKGRWVARVEGECGLVVRLRSNKGQPPALRVQQAAALQISCRRRRPVALRANAAGGRGELADCGRRRLARN